MSFAVVHAPEVAPYRLTADDLLWAARASQYEGGDPADTLWTWTQRHALPNYRSRYPALAALIQAHSQPVNPIWRRDGSKCRPGGSHANTDYCSEARLRRRDEAARRSFESLDADVQQKARAWAEGRLPNPVPGAVDFATQPVVTANQPNAPVVKRTSGNVFIAQQGSERWAPDRVRIVGDGRVPTTLPMAAQAVIAKASRSWVTPVLVLGSASVLTLSLLYLAWRRRVRPNRRRRRRAPRRLAA